MKNFSRIIDISLPIYPGMIRYPENPLVRFNKLSTGHSLLTEVALGTHSGTHVDFPRHVFKTGKKIDRFPLKLFIGPCRVLDMTHVSDGITTADLIKERIKKGERILVRTRNSGRSYKRFRSDYVYLDGQAADFLAMKKIVLFGIDYLSIKKRSDKDHRPHTSLLKKDIPIIEGVYLNQVKPGRYFLIVLPLKLSGVEGAPVRAVLLK